MLKYVMVTYEFGEPIFIAPLKDLNIVVTGNREEAELWDERDTLSSMKLSFHKYSTGYSQLQFEKA